MNDWTIVLICLLVSAFTSGTELAFLSSNKLRFELDRSQGVFSARILWNLIKSPSHFIASMLIANNIALVIYGIYMSEHLMTREWLRMILPVALHGNGMLLVIQTILSTLIILIAAEFIPKVLFRINPNAILSFLAIPIRALYYFLYPIVWAIMHLSRLLMRALYGIEFVDERPVFGRVDLDFYIREINSKNNKVEEMEFFKMLLILKKCVCVNA
jgi:CBS domain containing-hemolysin-like protein